MMALSKVVKIDKLEIIGDFKSIQCRKATVIIEDGVEISKTFHRHVLEPSHCTADRDSNGVYDGTFTHTDTDISGEPAETQAICNIVWTDEVKAAWKTYEESLDIY
jgi:hypothetical protein